MKFDVKKYLGAVKSRILCLREERAEKKQNKKERTPLQKTVFAVLRAIPAILIEVIAIYITLTCELDGKGDLLVAFTLLAGIAALLLGVIKPRIPTVFKWLPYAVNPFVTFIMLEYLTNDPFEMRLNIILLNVALFAAIQLTLTAVIGRTAPAVVLTCFVPILLGFVSYFTSEFRGTPLLPWDLASYGIAATVLGEYKIVITPKLGLIAACTVLTCVTAVVWNVRFRFKKSRLIRPAVAVVLIAVTGFYSSYLQSDRCITDQGLYPYLFTPDHLYKTNGFAVSFTMNLRYTTVDKPKGYNEDKVEELSEQYTSDKASDAGDTRPNIIVIMNESFADMTALCDFETNMPYMPNIDAMTENTIKGKLHASVVGGNTPNAEFEFLTGMTMGFLPAGSIPYQQFLRSERVSIATQLSDLGYTTVAMHPYWADGWKRNQIYPMLGFDEMYFLNESFRTAERLRGYVSDRGVYETIIEQFEEDTSDDPRFVFAVTMQNHGGYGTSYKNFTPEVTVDGLEKSFSVTNYMSLVRESDAAFAELVDYFKDYDEPTIILMFGDHQPNDSIANPLLRLAGKTLSETDIPASEGRYVVPYIITANFPLEGDVPKELSTNYLATVLTDLAGLPQTGAQRYMSSLMQEFPVITARCIIDKDGAISPVSDYDEYDSLERYSYLQYNYLFDYGDIPDGFFSLK